MSQVDPCGESGNGCPHRNGLPIPPPRVGDEPSRHSKLCYLFIKHDSTSHAENSCRQFLQEHTVVRALGDWVQPANP